MQQSLLLHTRENKGNFEQVAVYQQLQLAPLELHKALGDVQAQAAALGIAGHIAPAIPIAR